MPGFLGYAGEVEKSNLFSKSENHIDNLLTENIRSNGFFLERRTIKKFLNDKLFVETDQFFVLLEGTIFKIDDLCKKYNRAEFLNTIMEMYHKNGDAFFIEFRGTFSGVLFDKRKNKKIIFTDHIGDKQVFFHQTKGFFLFGSELNYLVEYFKNNDLNYSFNENAAYFLLTFGYMLEDNTLFNEFKKLQAGHYILIEGNTVSIHQYYQLDNTPKDELTEEEIIENVDSLFRQATKRQFDKDKEYGYNHLVALSGGLDSRMTTWVANDLGYGENIVNFTFSQSDYDDETIAKEIARDLKHEWIFKFLDNGLCLKNLEQVLKITSGNCIYSGQSHGKSALDLIDKSNFGILHSGQLGDVILGTYSSEPKHIPYTLFDGVYSRKYIKRLDKSVIKRNYPNQELFKMYQRGFNGINQGLLPMQESMETFSPFYDIEFLEFCFHIPVELRFNHYIYFKWIQKKYPEAAKYKWEILRGKITETKVTIRGHLILLRRLPIVVMQYYLNKLGFKVFPINTKNHMNPFDYWYNTNEDLKIFMDEYYHENIESLDSYTPLKKDCKDLYTKGSASEKTQVLTLLAFLKLNFG